jgi:hypothetical protein
VRYDAWLGAAKAAAEQIVAHPRFSVRREWSIDLLANQVVMRCAGIVTAIHPGSACVKPADHDVWGDSEVWSIGCSPASLLETGEQWMKQLTRCRTEAESQATKMHFWVLRQMSEDWKFQFVNALLGGRIQIMARKNSIFAPFEPVALDQWKFFRLNEPSEKSKENWIGPQNVNSSALSECTATGPAGERLFAIYVAPGVGSGVGQAVQQKCRRWIEKS